MFKLLKRLFGKASPGQVQEQAKDDSGVAHFLTRNEIGVTIDRDGFGPEAREALNQEVVRRAGRSLFRGTIEHAYTQRAVGATLQCPRCHAPTQQHCAEFIYATNRGLRAMLAPAGFFCTACSTVIIDEDLLAKGMKPGFQFQGVVGIDNPDTKEPNLFQTWNGKKPVYIFDEDQQCLGLETLDGTGERAGDWKDQGFSPPRAVDHGKLKRKRKLAKLARKRNRRP
ncbi:MAG: hypothetical protein AAB466_09675 [Verrucomicrobiota bacterium]